MKAVGEPALGAESGGLAGPGVGAAAASAATQSPGLMLILRRTESKHRHELYAGEAGARGVAPGIALGRRGAGVGENRPPPGTVT